MNDKVQIGRLAMRHEGENWNAYYALSNTMEDSILLGSIKMTLAENPKIKEGFINLMREAVSDILEEKTGQRPTWPEGPQGAPEHERSGHG